MKVKVRARVRVAEGGGEGEAKVRDRLEHLPASSINGATRLYFCFGASI